MGIFFSLCSILLYSVDIGICCSPQTDFYQFEEDISNISEAGINGNQGLGSIYMLIIIMVRLIK